jgi:hypothetical protein
VIAAGHSQRSPRGRGAALGTLFEGLCARFQAPRAGSLRAVVDWEVRDRPGTVDRIRLRIGGGRCRFQLDPSPHEGAAALILSIGMADLGLLLTGRASVSELFLRQRLQMVGDILLASRLPGLFAPACDPTRRPGDRVLVGAHSPGCGDWGPGREHG